MKTTIPTEIALIGKRLRQQNNRATANPIFCVQVCERIGPMDPSETDDQIYFYDHENCTTYYHDGIDAIQFRRYELLDDNDLLPEHISKHGYKEIWQTVATCFSEQGCQDHIDSNKHRYVEYHGIRIYADSIFRNAEMQALRDFLLSLPAPTQKATPLIPAP